MAHILIFEQDYWAEKALFRRLCDLGHNVQSPSSTVEAVALLERLDLDIMLVNTSEHSSDGLALLKHERALSRSIHARVIVITESALVEEKLRAFAAGADDHMSKPYDLRELLARMEALLKRPAVFAPERLKVGELELDKKRRQLQFEGKAVSLQPQDLCLLEYLMTHPSDVFTAEHLLDNVWPPTSNASLNGLRVAVTRIRRAFRQLGIADIAIGSIPKQGYTFACASAFKSKSKTDEKVMQFDPSFFATLTATATQPINQILSTDNDSTRR